MKKSEYEIHPGRIQALGGMEDGWVVVFRGVRDATFAARSDALAYVARDGAAPNRRRPPLRLRAKKDMMRRLYHSRRRDGLCVRCGQPAARTKDGAAMAKCDWHLAVANGLDIALLA